MNRRRYRLLACAAALALITGAGRLRGQEAPVDRTRLESEAAALAAEADRLYQGGDPAAALPLYRAERAVRRQLGDRRYEAHAARGEGCCLAALGAYEPAIAAWREALTVDLERDDPGFAGYDTLLIGRIAFEYLGRSGEAVATLESALGLLGRAEDRDHEADARRFLGLALIELGRADDAMPHLYRAVDLCEALDDPERRARSLEGAGLAAWLSGQPGAGAEYLAQAVESFLALGLDGESAGAERRLGDALLSLELPEAAAARVESAIARYEALEDLSAVADGLLFLAALRIDAGDLPGALALGGRAVEAARVGDDPEIEHEALVVLADIQAKAGDWGRATKTLEEAIEPGLFEDVPEERVRLLLLAAEVAARAGDHDRRAAWLEAANRAATDSDEPALVAAVESARRRIAAIGR